MKRLIWEIKYYLSKLRFYRSFKGGKWYYVKPKCQYGIYGRYWIKRAPLSSEVVIKTEVY
ncbi:hypothetical protein GCM10008934_02520 [Virgibacillus salarius]|uniref:hypothetical protein n=1 Tax=Virgibacillus salarius TaxID=447199 RepID=UPI0031CEC123